MSLETSSSESAIVTRGPANGASAKCSCTMKLVVQQTDAGQYQYDGKKSRLQHKNHTPSPAAHKLAEAKKPLKFSESDLNALRLLVDVKATTASIRQMLIKMGITSHLNAMQIHNMVARIRHAIAIGKIDELKLDAASQVPLDAQQFGEMLYAMSKFLKMPSNCRRWRSSSQPYSLVFTTKFHTALMQQA